MKSTNVAKFYTGVSNKGLKHLQFYEKECFVTNSAIFLGIYEFVKCKTTEQLILHDQIYKYIRKDGQNSLWECSKSDCSASCSTRTGKVVTRTGLHNHEVSTKYIMKKRKEGKIVKRKLA